MIIRQTTHRSSIKYFFVLLRSKLSLWRSENMLWSYQIFILIKFLEFPHVYTLISNLEFHWSKIESVVHPIFSRMESLVFFQTFKPLDVFVVCLITIITSKGHCVHSQKPLSSIFQYIIIKNSTFSKLSYLTTNWIIFWTSKVYFWDFE